MTCGCWCSSRSRGCICDGTPGFSRVVATIRQELDANWAHVHPQLDPEDDNDPMQRSNALVLLRDPARVLRALRDMPLAGNQRIGRVCWRDIAVLNGSAEPEPDRPKLTASEVLGIFRDSDKAQVAATREALDALLVDRPRYRCRLRCACRAGQCAGLRRRC